MKKKSDSKLRKECVTLAKKIVRKLKNYTCDYCHKKEPQVKTHGSHVYSEHQYKSMSADLDNIIVLCYTHHIGGWNANEPAWHKDPLFMSDWFRTTFPAQYNSLKKRAQKPQYCDRQFWENKLKELTNIWDKLNQTEWA